VPTAETLTARLTEAERDRSHPPVPVRDAASLIVYDREGPSVLMGRRNARHAFMPNRFVFPGGRVDPADSRVAIAAPFDPVTQRKLAAHTSARHGPARLRAFGVAALREAFEETGVLIGRPSAGATPTSPAFAAFAARGLGLDLSRLAFVARAVTPPGRPRRYDTRFFLLPREAVIDIDPTIVGDNAELEEIAWVPVDEARALPLPTITLTVLDEMTERLAKDPHLSQDAPVPFYRWRGSGFTRIVL